MIIRYPKFLLWLAINVFFTIMAWYSWIEYQENYLVVTPEMTVSDNLILSIPHGVVVNTPVVEAADDQPFSLRIGEVVYRSEAQSGEFGESSHYRVEVPFLADQFNTFSLESSSESSVSIRVTDGELTVPEIWAWDKYDPFATRESTLFMIALMAFGTAALFILYPNLPANP